MKERTKSKVSAAVKAIETAIQELEIEREDEIAKSSESFAVAARNHLRFGGIRPTVVRSARLGDIAEAINRSKAMIEVLVPFHDDDIPF